MDVELYSKEITKYTQLVENAKALQETGEREYNKLVKEKNATVAELKMNKSTKEIYDRLENIGKNNHSTRMLESVREGLIESKEQAVGATSVYNNKTSTKIEKIENTTRSAKTNDYIESLKNKYQTK
jgi:phage shock protein A